MSSPNRLGESFSTDITIILGLLLTAFTPLLQYPVISPPLHSFALSTYCVMMMLCTIALIVNVSLQRVGSNSRTCHRSDIMRTVSVLTGSLAIISLLSINKPYIALVFLLVWLFLAIQLILGLYQDLTQPILPITINPTSNSISTIFGMMKNWATNLFH